MDGNGYHGVFAVLLLQTVGLVVGIGAVYAALAGEVLNQHATADGRRLDVDEPLVLADVAARGQEAENGCPKHEPLIHHQVILSHFSFII